MYRAQCPVPQTTTEHSTEPPSHWSRSATGYSVRLPLSGSDPRVLASGGSGTRVSTNNTCTKICVPFFALKCTIVSVVCKGLAQLWIHLEVTGV